MISSLSSWRHKLTKNESVSAKREHHADFFANVWMENLGRGSKTQILSHHSQLWCLKITEKVSFNIASEASYVYILSGQKFIKNA